MIDAGHRACIEAALNHEKTDRTPVNNFVLATAARSAGVTVDAARWDPKVSAKVSVDHAVKTKSDFVKPVLDSQVPYKDLGMEVRFPEDDYGQILKPIAEDAEQIDKLAFFDPSVASECPSFQKVFVEALEETARILPEDLHICGLSWGPITTSGYIMGVENMVMGMLIDPDLVLTLQKKVTPFVSAMQRRMIEAGATVMWMADPTSSEDLISPVMFHEFSSPFISHIVKDVNNMDSSIPTFVHICGNTLDILKEMPETGADCLSFDHAVDPEKAKSTAGNKIAIMGNVDPVKVMMMGNPESITKACYDVIDAAGRESGFILAPGCETPISTSDENVLAMGEAARTYWTR
jgi:uroporphyrinogen decarboxylase